MPSAMTLEGLSRVLTPDGSTPYDAWSLNPASELEPSEILLDVERLNLDATSFRDLWERHGGDQDEVAAEVLAIVAERGKMHNPRTGSGGVMMGRVAQIGGDRLGEIALGEPVVTLVSNTVVPLSLSAVRGMDANTHQLAVEGRAILSPAARYARIPADLPLPLALGVFDVCGVVPQTRRLAKPGARVLVIGAAGKAGLLATYAAAEAVGPEGQVVAVVPLRHELSRLKDLPEWVTPVLADATRAPELSRAVLEASGGDLMDGVIDCASARGTEVGAVACCREGGEIYYFNMATSFQAAALGAEAVGRDVRMLVGFGLLPSAPEEALALVREQPVLRERLEAMTGS
ncbi:L-erythro-3,5-diaminohexanoate dehydrogenase [bacterium]|nr:L-erythro-3,5-diaminohexanoate dehydrogenase [bacterium]